MPTGRARAASDRDERRQAPGLGSAALEEAGDDRLLDRSAEGDGAAFRMLVRRHSPRLLAIARRMLGSDAAAEDVAQETLLRLWRKGAGLEIGDAGVGGWLYRVASNLCLDHIRSRRPESPDGLDQQQVPARQDRTLIERDLATRVERALQALPERQRLAIVLCHYEELSMSEAAKVLETSADAVESLLGRARRALRSNLESEWRALLPGRE